MRNVFTGDEAFTRNIIYIEIIGSMIFGFGSNSYFIGGEVGGKYAIEDADNCGKMG